MSVAQFDLFSRPPAAPMIRDAAPAPVAHPLRPYQVEAVGRVAAGWNEAVRSQLIVMPTGTGKTRVFSEIVKNHRGNVVVIAHRDELIAQARAALQRNCGELVSTEKAELRAEGTRIVVASVQTLKGDRLARFAQRHRASLVVVDEAHHAVSPSYKAIFEAFDDAQLLGVTATPDRSDELAMGQVFDSVAFVYEIQDAIRDGYLCPIRVKQVLVGAIDLSGVGTVAGDLNQGELDAVMRAEEVLHGIIAPVGKGDSLIELAADRRTIGFFTSVDAAHRAAEVINRYKPDSARAVDGTTATDTRRRLLRDFDEGRYQFLCNVGVLTEGYDSPGVACVAMCRPTKSRALYAQCVGRGLRPLPDKADCLVLDFVGNSGKHQLVSALDILAGKYDDEVVEAARDILEAQGMDGILAEDALERAQKEIDERKAREAAKRLRVTAKKADRVVIDRDPFALLGVERDDDTRSRRYVAEATPGQLETLRKFGIEGIEGMTKAQAHRLLDKCFERVRSGRATFKQVRFLKSKGVDATDLPMAHASAYFEAIKANGWKPLPPAELARLRSMSFAREPGEEG